MLSHRPSRRAFLLGALIFAGPARAQGNATFADGLVAHVPHGFAAQLNSDVLQVTESAAVRAPLSLTLGIDPHFSLHSTWIASRRGDIWYTVRNIGGVGSGGPVHELRATRLLDDGTSLALTAHRQAELSPDFEIALRLLSSVQRFPSERRTYVPSREQDPGH